MKTVLLICALVVGGWADDTLMVSSPICKYRSKVFDGFKVSGNFEDFFPSNEIDTIFSTNEKPQLFHSASFIVNGNDPSYDPHPSLTLPTIFRCDKSDSVWKITDWYDTCKNDSITGFVHIYPITKPKGKK